MFKFSVLIVNMATIDKSNSHKQKLFRTLSDFSKWKV